jgi:hypothetical protein
VAYGRSAKKTAPAESDPQAGLFRSIRRDLTGPDGCSAEGRRRLCGSPGCPAWLPRPRARAVLPRAAREGMRLPRSVGQPHTDSRVARDGRAARTVRSRRPAPRPSERRRETRSCPRHRHPFPRPLSRSPRPLPPAPTAPPQGVPTRPMRNTYAAVRSACPGGVDSARHCVTRTWPRSAAPDLRHRTVTAAHRVLRGAHPETRPRSAPSGRGRPSSPRGRAAPARPGNGPAVTA